MKIALTPYPFAGLSGTAKKPVSVPADNGGLAAAGTSRPPVRLDVAVLRYLRTVEEMTAQIMDMTGDGPPAVVDEYPGTTPAGVSGGSAIARGDILVFFPGPAPDGENEDNGAELVVVKGTGRAEYAAASETPREEALEGLAKDVGQALARLGRGGAPVVFDHGPPRPRERFIVSVDTVDGVTVPTVIHDAPSGVALVFNNGGGELSDGAIPDEVSAIVGLLSGGGTPERMGRTVRDGAGSRVTGGRRPAAGNRSEDCGEFPSLEPGRGPEGHGAHGAALLRCQG
jgi:hypothetical protein